MSEKYAFDEEQHLHTLDGRPLTGCSSVGSVLAKPLTWWAAGLAVGELGWTKSMDGKKPIPKELRLKRIAEVFPTIKNMTDEQYLALLDKGYRAHQSTLNKSATAGVSKHATVEKFVTAQINGVKSDLTDEEREAIQSFINWANKNVKRFIFSEKNCYSKKHWVGGISDVGVELKDGSIAIIDIKSSKDAYPNQFFQIGGYNLCISENGLLDRNGNKLGELEKPITVHIVFPFGMKEPTAVIQKDVKRDIDAFLSELTLYRILASYEE